MTNTQLARQIAKYLFTNGGGQHARRLVLELQDGRDGGGWSERAVQDAIKKILDEQNTPRDTEPHGGQ